MRNFNEIIRKDVIYDNIQTNKKPEFHPLFREYFFGKTTGVTQGGTPQPF